MVILRSDNLSGAGLAHGFFGRTGGVSTGIFASLNCGPGSGDGAGPGPGIGLGVGPGWGVGGCGAGPGSG